MYRLSDCITVNHPLTNHGHVFTGMFTNESEECECVVKFPRETTQFERETNALIQLGRSNNVITLLDSGFLQNQIFTRPYIVLEKCHDLDFHKLVMSRWETVPVYDVNWAIDICKQIINGVTFIHDSLYVHKDLKPSNILLTQDLRSVKVADFGSSQKLGNAKEAVFCSDMFGTTGYRPPESYGNSHVSLLTDIFSLGATFYFILSNGKSPFGGHEDMWDYNAKNGITNMCDLQVPNRKTTKHLISSMLHIKRHRRPTIWQVGSHPCWGGNETDFEHKYRFPENLAPVEDNTSELEPPVQNFRVPNPSDTEIENAEFLKMLENLPPTTVRPKKAMEKEIVIFDKKQSRLYRFSLQRGSLSRYQDYSGEMRRNFFTAVAHDNDIYVLCHGKSVYRLACNNEKVRWKKMSDMIVYHGQYPPALTNGKFIYVVGISEHDLSRSITKFEPSTNTWENLPEKAIKTAASATASLNKYIYCLGGIIDEAHTATDTVERIDVELCKWRNVASLNIARFQAAAMPFEGHIYIFGGKSSNRCRMNTVEKFNAQSEQWTVSVPMINSRWGPRFRCDEVNGDIYAVGGDGVQYGETIEKYDRIAEEWSLVEVDMTSIEIWASVTVNLEIRD